jgi:hypothetical protein
MIEGKSLFMNRCTLNPRFTAVISSLLVMALAGCNLPGNEATTPTVNVTQAYQTVEARLTEAISQTPRSTATDPPLATATTAPPTAVPTRPAVTVTAAATQPPDALCDQALAGVPIDVTVPDDTQFTPGEQFTKTWRLQNAGTCTWTTEYALAWFSGEQLGAPLAVPLAAQVSPGQTVDLSVDMRAPETAGTFQSNWKIRNPTGTLFGIGPSGGSAFWVRIAVAGSGTTTVSPTPSTITPTSTSTPGVQVTGAATLHTGDQYDLDNNLVNSGGEDVTFHVSEQGHILTPVGDAAMVDFGNSEPTLAECQSLELSTNPISATDLIGSYLCYRTNMTLPGWMLVNDIDSDTGDLRAVIFTWAIP